MKVEVVRRRTQTRGVFVEPAKALIAAVAQQPAHAICDVAVVDV
jgi:hypothetical protein